MVTSNETVESVVTMSLTMVDAAGMAWLVGTSDVAAERGQDEGPEVTIGTGQYLGFWYHAIAVESQVVFDIPLSTSGL